VKDKEAESPTSAGGSGRRRILSKQTIQQNEVYRQLQGNELTFQTMLADSTPASPGSSIGSRRRATACTRCATRFKIDNMKQDADQKEYAFDLYCESRRGAHHRAMKNQSMVAVSIVEHAIPPLDP
jgi:hypothetical protein